MQLLGTNALYSIRAVEGIQSQSLGASKQEQWGPCLHEGAGYTKAHLLSLSLLSLTLQLCGGCKDFRFLNKEKNIEAQRG